MSASESRQLVVHAYQVAPILPVLQDAFLAQAVASLTVQRTFVDRSADGLWPAQPMMDDAAFCAVVACFPNLLRLHMRTFGFVSLQEHLLSQLSFSRLTEFALGGYRITVPTFFALLSMMPALKILGFGNVATSAEAFSRKIPDRKDVDESAFARPACSLTHLVVSYEIGLTEEKGFWHYPLLLSRSHNTLEVVELRWLPYPETGDDMRAALAPCTRVRHLSLLGNMFPTAPLIAACPRLQSMSLEAMPTADEMAALRAPLFRLEIFCGGSDPLQLIAETLHRLRAIIHDVPNLQIIWLNLAGQPLQRETGALRELRALCRERRVYLSVLYEGGPP